MSEELGAALVIDLEEDQAWGNSELPVHVPLIYSFIIDKETIPVAIDHLTDEFNKNKSFEVAVKMDSGAQLRRKFFSFALMRLHLDALHTLRPLAKSIDERFTRDLYEPIIRGPQGSGAGMQSHWLKRICFALAQPGEGHEIHWTNHHDFRLRDADE